MQKYIQIIDEHIKNGRRDVALQSLLDLELKKLNRDECFQCAQLARRLHQPKIMIKLLHSTIRPNVVGFIRPEPAEVALYASGLTRLGVYKEARKLLESVQDQDCVEVLLFMADLSTFNWDYKSALTWLRKYKKKN